MHLQHAHRARFAHHAAPGFSVELGRAALEPQWIGTIGAGERAPMGQLGEEPERCCDRVHGKTSNMRLSASVWSRFTMSVRIRSRGALYAPANSSAISATLTLPSQR